MNFHAAQLTLAYLCDYLIDHHALAPSFMSLSLEIDPEQDEKNKKDPRAFCYVTPGVLTIFTTLALPALPPEAMMGVMLHEIAHLHLNAFKGDESEVDVDAFCTCEISESGYHYANVEYLSPFHNHTKVIATNLEKVSPMFFRRVIGN